MEESHILHGKKDTTLDFFFSSDRSVSSGVFTPLGSQLPPSLRSCVKTTLGGVKTPSETLLPEEKKKILGGILFPWRKETFRSVLMNWMRRIFRLSSKKRKPQDRHSFNATIYWWCTSTIIDWFMIG